MMDQDHNDLSLCDLIMDGLDLITNTCFILFFLLCLKSGNGEKCLRIYTLVCFREAAYTRRLDFSK